MGSSKKAKEKEFFTGEYIKIPRLVEKSFFETLLDPSDSFAMLSYEHFNYINIYLFVTVMKFAIGLCWIAFVLERLVRRGAYYTNMIKNFLIIVATIIISCILYYVSMIPIFIFCYNNINALPQTDFYVLIGFIIVVAIFVLSYHLAIYERGNEYDEEGKER